MTTKLTIDNLDVSHSTTFEEMHDARSSFASCVPPINPLSSPISSPTFYSHLDRLFGIQSIFKVFSGFTLPKAFARIRFMFYHRMITKLCPTACMECVKKEMDLNPDLRREAESLLVCFSELENLEGLLQQITIRIRSHQKP